MTRHLDQHENCQHLNGSSTALAGSWSPVAVQRAPGTRQDQGRRRSLRAGVLPLTAYGTGRRLDDRNGRATSGTAVSLARRLSQFEIAVPNTVQTSSPPSVGELSNE